MLSRSKSYFVVFFRGVMKRDVLKRQVLFSDELQKGIVCLQMFLLRCHCVIKIGRNITSVLFIVVHKSVFPRTLDHL